jgi:hypothetical protein
VMPMFLKQDQKEQHSDHVSRELWLRWMSTLLCLSLKIVTRILVQAKLDTVTNSNFSLHASES